MCFYNEEVQHFINAVESILNQSYKDFEFIIVSDNPSNALLNDIAFDYSKRDSRIKLIYNNINIGLTRSLNVGLSICSGDYIVRMDADDISMENRLSKQVEFMDNHPDIVASGTNCFLIDEKNNIVGKNVANCNPLVIKNLLCFYTQISHPSAIIRRIVDGKLFQYDECFKYAQDYALWASLIKNNFSNIPEFLVKYRKSNNQVSSLHIQEQIKLGRLAQKKVVEYLQLPLNDYEFDQVSRVINLDGTLSITSIDYRRIIVKIVENKNNYLYSKSIVADFLLQKYISYLQIISNYNFFKIAYILFNIPSGFNIRNLNYLIRIKMSHYLNKSN